MDVAPTPAPSTAVPGAASTSPTAPTLAPQPLLARLGLATRSAAGRPVERGHHRIPCAPRPACAAPRATCASKRRATGRDHQRQHRPGAGAGQRDHHHASIHRCHQPGTPAGVRQAELSVQLDADSLNARLQWASARAGEIDATASTRLQWGADAAPWPADAPLAGSVRARLPDVGVWSALGTPRLARARHAGCQRHVVGHAATPRAGLARWRLMSWPCARSSMAWTCKAAACGPACAATSWS